MSGGQPEECSFPHRLANPEYTYRLPARRDF
jgi:hypothetical protein